MLWVLAIVEIGSAAIGAYVAAQKRRSPVEGFLFGVLLGPFGVLAAVLMPEGSRAGRVRSAEPEEPDRIDATAWDTRQAAGVPRVRI